MAHGMSPPHFSPAVATVAEPDPTSPETDVKTRVFAWCSAWSSIKGRFQPERLEEIAADGAVRMTADFGDVISVSVTLDAYVAFWGHLLSETFAEWFLVVDSPLRIAVSDGYATASFDARLQGITHDGQRKSHRQAMQQTFEKSGGGWRLIQEQAKIPPEGACF